jgi:Protein of unknown function (DUF2281)
LPANAQQELFDFYEFLLEKYSNEKNKREAVQVDGKVQNSLAKVGDFKTFILSIPKIEAIEFERQRDFPKDIVL